MPLNPQNIAPTHILAQATAFLREISERNQPLSTLDWSFAPTRSCIQVICGSTLQTGRPPPFPTGLHPWPRVGRVPFGSHSYRSSDSPGEAGQARRFRSAVPVSTAPTCPCDALLGPCFKTGEVFRYNIMLLIGSILLHRATWTSLYHRNVKVFSLAI